MFDRPPLLEEPFAQTLSGKNLEKPWITWGNHGGFDFSWDDIHDIHFSGVVSLCRCCDYKVLCNILQLQAANEHW